MSSYFAATNAAAADDALYTIKRQAKRLSTSLKIPRWSAKHLLATLAYRCVDWKDLEARVAERQPSSEVLLLAQKPGSAAAKAYLGENVRSIARTIGNCLLTNRNLTGMCEVLHYVFSGKEKQADITDVFDGVNKLTWYSAHIGPDPYAVIESRLRVNGVAVKLLGTRIYLPQYENFGEDLDKSSYFAAHFDTPFEIIWHSPADWHTAAYAYLTAPEDDDAELVLPSCELDAAMEQHETWFKRVLQHWRRESRYGDQQDETRFLPMVTNEGCYLVLGVPTVVPSMDGYEEPSIDIPCDETSDEFPVFHLAGNPFYFASLQQPWEADDKNDCGEGDTFDAHNPLLDIPGCDQQHSLHRAIVLFTFGRHHVGISTLHCASKSRHRQVRMPTSSRPTTSTSPMRYCVELKNATSPRTRQASEPPIM